MARLLRGKQILDGSIDLGKLNSSSPTDVTFVTGVMIGATVAALTGGTYTATGGTNASGSFSGVDTAIDGIALVDGDRVLVKNQADAKQNGLYVVVTAASGAWERSTDHDGTPSNEVSSGNFAFVEVGTVNATSGWVLQGDGELALNTDDLDWVQFSENTSLTAGNGVDIVGSTISADPDLSTIIATGGTGDQLSVLKVPNALTNGTGIATMSFDGSAAETIVIDNTGVVAAAYGSASSVATFTVNAQGQLTTADTVSISITTSQISDYDTEQFVTGGTYSNGTGNITFTDNLGGTFTVDLSAMDLNDTFVTGGTYSNATGDITFTLNDASTFAVDLSSLDLNDTFTTGTTLVGTTLYFDTTDALSAYTADLSSLLDDTNFYATGSTLIGSTAYFDRTDTLSAFTLDLSALDVNDTFVTGGTYSNATGDITFTNNDAGTFAVDLSSLDLNDTFTTGTTLVGSTAYFNTTDSLSAYTLDLSSFAAAEKFVTGGTVSSGSLSLDMNDDTTVNVTGTIIQSVSGNSPITASTTNGAVSVGIDSSSLERAVGIVADKDLAPTGATTGSNFDTGLSIGSTPAKDGYVRVSVNGVGYILGDATTGATADCYFSSNGGTTASAISAIAAGDVLYWNGDDVGFQLDATDNVDFEYDVLQ
jgi:hypothetical protein